MKDSTAVVTWYRRWDKLPIAVAILWAAGPLANAVLNQPVPTRKLLGLIAVLPMGACIGYLAGPAAAFGTTAGRIIVENPFFRYSIPRHLFDDITALENVAVQIVTKDGKEVPIQCVLPAIGSVDSQSHRRLVGKIAILFQMIEEIPAAASVGEVERRIRLGSVFLVVGSAVAFAMAVHLLIG